MINIDLIKRIIPIVVGATILFGGSSVGATAGEKSPAQITVFDVPGATQTLPYGINKSGYITGTYMTDNFHAFLRNPQGDIINIDPPGGAVAFGQQINSSGSVTGFFGSGSAYGFIRDIEGHFTIFQVENQSTVAVSINDSGTVTGDYTDTKNASQGFVRAPDGTISTINPTGASYTYCYGINNYGDVTGTYLGSDGIGYGFVRKANTKIVSFVVPGATGTEGVSINSRGDVTGAYTTGSSNTFGFIRYANGKITTFAIPISGTETFPSYILNDASVIGFHENRKRQKNNAFIRKADGHVIRFAVEGSNGTAPVAATEKEIVGVYYLRNSPYPHGFVRTN